MALLASIAFFAADSVAAELEELAPQLYNIKEITVSARHVTTLYCFIVAYLFSYYTIIADTKIIVAIAQELYKTEQVSPNLFPMLYRHKAYTQHTILKKLLGTDYFLL